MKPKNFPGRKLTRQLVAQKRAFRSIDGEFFVKDEETLLLVENEREKRSKKFRGDPRERQSKSNE